MSTDFERLRRIDAHFAEALEREGAERDSYVAACPPELRTELLRLLEYADADESAGRSEAPRAETSSLPHPELSSGVWRAVEARLEQARTDRPSAAKHGEPARLEGERAGAFRLLHEIGRGGMSVVYLAERVEGGFQQRAAVKVVPESSNDPQLARRFDQERRILADLEHPNIARLLDGGSTQPQGQAYLAMEYVEGRTISRYSEEEHLTLDQRLALFLQVAGAVQFAHRRLVVHRDLKPSNILVDGRGVVKLLDFGIAKLLASTQPALTGSQERFLTLDYASPELFRGGAVTTASDVYQLGLVLYELLAGERAYRLAGRSVTEAQRLVCEQDPPPPSARAADSAPSIPAELDDVVLLALRKEPELRYGSVAELAADLERFRAGKPVHARPATALYLTRKFVRRHRLVVAAAAALVVALAAGLLGTAWQARQARREAARLAETQRFLVELFQDADPAGAGSLDRSVGSLLERGAERLLTGLTDQPELRAQLLGRLGGIYRELMAYEQAVPLLEEALATCRQLDGTARPRAATVAAMHELSAVLREMQSGRERAIELDRDALALVEESGSLEERVAARSHLANSLLVAQRLDEAETVLVRADVDVEALERPSHARSSLHSTWALLEQTRGSFDAAVLHLDAAVAEARLLPDQSPLGLALRLANLGRALNAAGRHREAAVLLRESLATIDQRFPRESAQHASIWASLALVHTDLAEFEQAREAAERAIAIYDTTVGPDEQRALIARMNHGYVLYRAGDLETSAEVFEDLLQRETERGSSDSVRSGMARVWYGRALIDSGRPSEAVAPLALARRILGDFYGEGDALATNARLELGIALSRTGRFGEAEPLLRFDRAALDTESLDSAERALLETLSRLDEAGRTEEAAALRAGWEQGAG